MEILNTSLFKITEAFIEMKFPNLRNSFFFPLICVGWNIILLYILYAIARGEFFILNYSFFQSAVHEGKILNLFASGLVFDTPGIFYTNILWILMILLPLQWKEKRGYYNVCKILFIVVNLLAFTVNIADSIYFSYTMRRTTIDVAGEFSNEGNILKIVAAEILNHWYLLLLILAVGFGLWKTYLSPKINNLNGHLLKYYVIMTISLLIAAVTSVSGIRGGLLNHWYLYLIAIPFGIISYEFLSSNLKNRAGWICGIITLGLICSAPIGGWRHRDIRPIAISNSGKYTTHPAETALILNTPFTLLRSIGNSPFVNPHYFDDSVSLVRYFSPIFLPSQPDSVMNKKNVVILIVESFGREYIGGLNKEILNPEYKGYTPFVDSLLNHSLTFKHSFCNGRKSIDGMPSILASIPMFVKPYILTPQALNKIEGLPALLNKEGYQTAFFHGARTGSMGFDGFAKTLGFSQYYGREDFDKDSRYGGENEFDGYWAIWDEPFLQYFATKLTDFKQPFMAAVFTASSHHPFHIPDRYKNKYPEEELLIHKCIRYTDNALREFFNTAKKQPWYENTIFVITSDHTNMSNHPEYKSDIGGFRVPIIFYDPSGKSFPIGMKDEVAQQIDIMPTILHLLGFNKSFFAFGKNLLENSDEKYGAVNYLSGIYQLVDNGYVIQFDGTKTTGIYRLEDYRMKNNLLGKNVNCKDEVTKLKALIQIYMERMLSDSLTVK